jgi:hypothetical protein
VVYIGNGSVSRLEESKGMIEGRLMVLQENPWQIWEFTDFENPELILDLEKSQLEMNNITQKDMKCKILTSYLDQHFKPVLVVNSGFQLKFHKISEEGISKFTGESEEIVFNFEENIVSVAHLPGLKHIVALSNGDIHILSSHKIEENLEFLSSFNFFAEIGGPFSRKLNSIKICKTEKYSQESSFYLVAEIEGQNQQN